MKTTWLALLLVLAVLVQQATAVTIYVDTVNGADAVECCTSPGPGGAACATGQYAVDCSGLTVGDVIQYAAESFPAETVTVTVAGLIIRGAKFSQATSGRTSTTGETVLHPGYDFVLNADNLYLDGFWWETKGVLAGSGNDATFQFNIVVAHMTLNQDQAAFISSNHFKAGFTLSDTATSGSNVVTFTSNTFGCTFVIGGGSNGVRYDNLEFSGTTTMTNSSVCTKAVEFKSGNTGTYLSMGAVSFTASTSWTWYVYLAGGTSTLVVNITASHSERQVHGFVNKLYHGPYTGSSTQGLVFFNGHNDVFLTKELIVASYSGSSLNAEAFTMSAISAVSTNDPTNWPLIQYNTRVWNLFNHKQYGCQWTDNAWYHNYLVRSCPGESQTCWSPLEDIPQCNTKFVDVATPTVNFAYDPGTQLANLTVNMPTSVNTDNLKENTWEYWDVNFAPPTVTFGTAANIFSSSGMAYDTDYTSDCSITKRTADVPTYDQVFMQSGFTTYQQGTPGSSYPFWNTWSFTSNVERVTTQRNITSMSTCHTYASNMALIQQSNSSYLVYTMTLYVTNVRPNYVLSSTNGWVYQTWPMQLTIALDGSGGASTSVSISAIPDHRMVSISATPNTLGQAVGNANVTIVVTTYTASDWTDGGNVPATFLQSTSASVAKPSGASGSEPSSKLATSRVSTRPVCVMTTMPEDSSLAACAQTYTFTVNWAYASTLSSMITMGSVWTFSMDIVQCTAASSDPRDAADITDTAQCDIQKGTFTFTMEPSLSMNTGEQQSSYIPITIGAVTAQNGRDLTDANQPPLANAEYIRLNFTLPSTYRHYATKVVAALICPGNIVSETTASFQFVNVTTNMNGGCFTRPSTQRYTIFNDHTLPTATYGTALSIFAATTSESTQGKAGLAFRNLALGNSYGTYTVNVILSYQDPSIPWSSRRLLQVSSGLSGKSIAAVALRYEACSHSVSTHSVCLDEIVPDVSTCTPYIAISCLSLGLAIGCSVLFAALLALVLGLIYRNRQVIYSRLTRTDPVATNGGTKNKGKGKYSKVGSSSA